VINKPLIKTLAGFIEAYIFARRLKMLNGLRRKNAFAKSAFQSQIGSWLIQSTRHWD
jgi:hypothetical protein